jgi:hypothetical protein
MISFPILQLGGATNHRTLFPEPAVKRVFHKITKAVVKRNVRFP